MKSADFSATGELAGISGQPGGGTERGPEGPELKKSYKMPSRGEPLLILPTAQNNTETVFSALTLPDVVNEGFFQ